MNAVTLHDLVVGKGSIVDAAWIERLYRDFLDTERDLWATTHDPSVRVDLHDLYGSRIERALDAIQAALGRDNLSEVAIRVNGDEHGPVGAIKAAFEERLQRAQPHITGACTVHGDDHAKNIVVYRRALGSDPTGWKMIDYPNARKDSDWVFAIAKMVHWWQLYALLEMAKKDAKLQKALAVKPLASKLASKHSQRGRLETLDIRYDTEALQSQMPDRCQRLDALAMQTAQDVGAAFGEREDVWQERLRLTLFAVLFGSSYRHFGKADFAVPIMIGESLKALGATSGSMVATQTPTALSARDGQHGAPPRAANGRRAGR